MLQNSQGEGKSKSRLCVWREGWRTVEDEQMLPSATRDGFSVTSPIPASHCVFHLFHYELQHLHLAGTLASIVYYLASINRTPRVTESQINELHRELHAAPSLHHPFAAYVQAQLDIAEASEGPSTLLAHEADVQVRGPSRGANILLLA